VVVSAASRTLRRQLRPLDWVVLEEVALDAVDEDGRLVARTSARQIAERLRVDAESAHRALRSLRRRGILGLEPDRSSSVRFELSLYVLASTSGLTVITSRPAQAPWSAGAAEPEPQQAPASSLLRLDHGGLDLGLRT
jgi:hypothetical protein